MNRLEVVDLTAGLTAPDLARDAAAGLAAAPKSLPCVHFYDAEGSRLFEEITAAPEYYLTRAELEVLDLRAGALAAASPAGTELVELGSGSSRKTRAVIEALLTRRETLRYVAVDVSRAALREAADGLLRDYPGLSMTAVVADYAAGLSWLAARPPAPRLLLYLGSSLGNFEPQGARALLSQAAAALAPGDRLVLGADLPKDPEVLEAAYNDEGGANARFNLNLLRRLNDELGARFDLEAFAHLAFYDEARRAVELHLVSLEPQTVPIAALGRDFTFARGERIHTEDSRKYALDEVAALAAEVGLRPQAVWTDARGWFGVSVLARA